MFHVELRQRAHQTRAFNLSEAELVRQFVGPILAGQPFDHDDREWEPKKLKLVVYEGPELPVEQMGMGRGWANVQKAGSEVTQAVLARGRGGAAGRPPELERLKERLLGRIAACAVPLEEVVTLSESLLPGRRVSERLGVAELAVWELLHVGEAALVEAGTALPAEEWQSRLLAWESWRGAQAMTSAISLARVSSDANR